VDSVNRRQVAVCTILAVVLVYGLVGSLVPAVPYRSETALLYPLLLFYKTTFLFHIGVVFLFIVVAIWIVSHPRTLFSHNGEWILGFLVLTMVGLIFFVGRSFFASDYRHHDTVTMGEYVYHLGSSSEDWPSLKYIVYCCDERGLICELADVPASGLNLSLLPSGTWADRSASFILDDDDNLLISIYEGNYPVSLDSSP
jgi:hypothetical protein